MKPSMRDRIKGELHEIKGKAKEKVGHITSNRRMAAAGRSETSRQNPKESRADQKGVWDVDRPGSTNASFIA